MDQNFVPSAKRTTLPTPIPWPVRDSFNRDQMDLDVNQNGNAVEDTCSAGARADTAQNQYDDIKLFLLKYGPIASRRFPTSAEELDSSFETPTSMNRAEYQGSDTNEMKVKLTVQIRKILCQVGSAETKSNFYRFQVATKLIQLH